MRDVCFAAVKIGLDNRADGGIALANAFYEVDGALRVSGSLHVNAQKIIEARGAFDDGEDQSFAEFNIDIQAKLGGLARNVGVQPFFSDAFKNLEIGIAGMLRIRGGSDIFAEVIETGVHAGVIALASSRNGFIQRFAGDESARHAVRRAIGSDPIGETFAFGKLEQGRPDNAVTVIAAQKARK